MGDGGGNNQVGYLNALKQYKRATNWIGIVHHYLYEQNASVINLDNGIILLFTIMMPEINFLINQ